MWLGIDVGGTFTDAVLVDQESVVAQSKAPTTHDDLLQGILAAIDRAVSDATAAQIERVALSTTVVTNAIIQDKVDPVELFIMPGPGMNLDGLFPVQAKRLTGYIDHRGRIVKKPSREEVLSAAGNCKNKIFAVAGKFAIRNPVNEEAVVSWLNEQGAKQITAASAVGGSLNFVRRTNAAYYNSACYYTFDAFADAMEAALAQRKITAPVHILKADGGTLPLAAARKLPVEAVFTGPAASVLGVMALADSAEQDAVSLDVGGTTTDIALWRKGKPLFAGRGATISGYNTSVRAFRLRSVGIGGDSFVRREAGTIQVGPMRLGPAIAVGGSEPTLSDAMIAAGVTSFGDQAAAIRGIAKLSLPDQSVQETALEILNVAAAVVRQAIEATIAEEAAQPVYTVSDIIHPDLFVPKQLIGVGGAAQGLVPVVGEQMKLSYQVPVGAPIANAIGAAVSRPTLSLTLRADTAENYYTIPELLVKRSITTRQFSLSDARRIVEEELLNKAGREEIAAEDLEEVYTEEFNMIRGFSTIGKMISCSLQVKPGVLMTFAAAKEGTSHE